MGGGWAWVCRQNEGSFGFAKRWHLCRAKTNVPECAVGFRFLSFLYAAKIPLSFCRLFCLFTMNANCGIVQHSMHIIRVVVSPFA